MSKLISAIPTASLTKDNQIKEKEKLLKQLLESVQECQRRYGGRKELATEYDSCVAGLCLSLEAVFLHGLKTKTCNIVEQNSSKLKHVSDIVVHSLSIGSDSLSFWTFIKKHLTKHEQERYLVLKHIWTDLGRAKAWIRSALNENSLERYFHTVLSNEELLKDHYESWAVLCDEDKNSMLPNMAAGLGSILFAVSIDKPELNSGIVQRPQITKNKGEPIVTAPIPGNMSRSKDTKKRKVARQFISFDNDDSALSTSVPSSSSSTASDISLSDTKEKILDARLKPYKEMNENEKSGNQEKLSAIIPETLTPVTHMEIGELTPISVEINKDFKPTDEVLEVPTDISIVLTAVEKKNQEELNRKDEKIALLTKENDALKEQVKKYVSAIQMLRRNDFDLEGLQIDEDFDYVDEAKIFQTKLVQVAEMHAELMDFNVMLQQSLCQKDVLIEKLKKQLESLKDHLFIDECNFDEAGSVSIWIPSAFLTGTGTNSHHVYQIFLRAGNDEWNIYRRYAQFYALHSDLKKLDPIVSSFDFPPKRTIGRKDSALVEQRRKTLQTYLRKIIAHWPELAHCNSRFLLEQHLSFFKDHRDDEYSKRNTFSTRKPGNLASNNHSAL